MKRLLILVLALTMAALACGTQASSTPFPTPVSSVFDSSRTTYGSFQPRRKFP
ncbi:MAG: hypothetical protein WBW94_14040 [Anaerolineales bacterium]